MQQLSKEYQSKGKHLSIEYIQKLINEKQKLKTFKIKLDSKDLEFKIKFIKYADEQPEDDP